MIPPSPVTEPIAGTDHRLGSIPPQIRNSLKGSKPSPLDVVDVKGMRGRPAPEVQWLLEQLLAQGEVGCLVGRSNCGKGFILLMLILAVTTGRGMFGRKGSNKPQKVLFLEMEDSEEELHRRIKRLMELMNLEKDWTNADTDNFFDNLAILKPNWKSEDSKTLKALLPAIHGQIEEIRKSGVEIGLVVLDTLAALSEGEENAVEAQRDTLAALFQLRDLSGATVLTVHHTRKPPSMGKALPIFDRLSFDSSRGSSAIVAAMRFILQMEPLTAAEAVKLDLDEDKAMRGGYVALTLSKVVGGPKGDLLVLEQVEGQGGGFWTVHPQSDELAAKLKSKMALANLSLAEAVLLSIADKLTDRGELCKKHWPGLDEQKARNNLKATLSHLRHRHRWLQGGADLRLTVQGQQRVDQFRARDRPPVGDQRGDQGDAGDDLY